MAIDDDRLEANWNSFVVSRSTVYAYCVVISYFCALTIYLLGVRVGNSSLPVNKTTSSFYRFAHKTMKKWLRWRSGAPASMYFSVCIEF